MYGDNEKSVTRFVIVQGPVEWYSGFKISAAQGHRVGRCVFEQQPFYFSWYHWVEWWTSCVCDWNSSHNVVKSRNRLTHQSCSFVITSPEGSSLTHRSQTTDTLKDFIRHKIAAKAVAMTWRAQQNFWVRLQVETSYKNLFLRKKIKPTTCSSWFGQSGKERWNLRQYGTKKLPPPFVENYYLTLSTNSGTELWRQEKLASRWVSSLASRMELSKK